MNLKSMWKFKMDNRLHEQGLITRDQTLFVEDVRVHGNESRCLKPL
jgi:hypothetical protein